MVQIDYKIEKEKAITKLEPCEIYEIQYKENIEDASLLFVAKNECICANSHEQLLHGTKEYFETEYNILRKVTDKIIISKVE